MAGAISVAGLTGFFRATVDGLDALNDVADATGATIENISALEDVAARTGTQMDTVSGALLKLNKVLSEAKPGSEIARTLESVGLSVEALKKEDPAEALRQVAEALAGYADDGNKARLMQELFGKSTKEVAAFMKDLAEQGKLNATVTAEQAAEAEKLNKQLFEFQKNVTDAARAIVSDMLPALNQFFERLRSVNTAGGLFTSIRKELRAEVVGDELKRVVAEIESIQATIDRQGGSDLLKKKLAGLRVEAAGLSKESAELSGWLKQFAQQSDPFSAQTAGNGRGFITPPMIRPSVPGLSDKPANGRAVRAPVSRDLVGPVMDPVRVDALKAIESTDTARIEKLRATLKDLFDLNRANPTPAVSEAIQDVLDQIGKLDPAAKAAAEAAKRIDAALAATPSARKADARARIDELQAAMKGTDDPVRLRQIEEAIDAIYEGIGAIPTVAEPVFAQLDEFTKNFAGKVQTTFGDTIFGALTGNFSSIGDAWKNMLLRMASDALAADLTKALFPAVQSTGGSAFGGLLSAITGGITGLFGGGRATGGGVRAGGIYSVVENGPELLQVGDRTMLMMGSQGGSVKPARRGGQAGDAGGVTVVQHFTFNGSPNPRELAAWGASIKAQTMAAMADSRRRGATAYGV